MQYLTFLGAAALFACAAAESLRVTAIAGRDMKSTIECWTFEQEYMNVQGMKIQQLGDLTKVTYTETPADREFEQGPYTPPNLQYFIILEGNATITFPTSDDVLRVEPRKLYIAADSAAVSKEGHTTVVSPGARLLQLPFKDGVVPAHTSVPGECGAGRAAHDEL